MHKYRLGLDLGTNSIGWCLLALDSENEPYKVLRSGARIFNDGRNPKDLASLKASRRVTRSASRRRDRFLRRQAALMDTLIDSGLMPQEETARKALVPLDPYPIRKAALHSEVHPHHMGRALFHLNRRRGFKSNRISAPRDNEAGVVKNSIARTEGALMDAGATTLGAYLAARHELGQTVRARRLGTGKKDEYELYSSRDMTESEFHKLWQAQAKYNPTLYTDELAQRLSGIIFHQRPLKPQEVGKCTFIDGEPRIAKALPAFQRFRIYQELANLRWIDKWNQAQLITQVPSLRDKLYTELNAKRELTFTAMRRILRKMGVVDYDVRFNLESKKRQALDGNATSHMMRHKDKGMGAAWDALSEARQDNLIALLLDDQAGDEDVRATLKAEYNLSDEIATRLLDIALPKGHGHISKAAIDEILPFMVNDGMPYYAAARKAGFDSHDPEAELSPHLEYYGKALSGHVLGASGKPEDGDEKRYGFITNPTVHIALNQVRQLVNELIRLHGKPEQIALEIARDLPMGAKGKREIIKQQSDNQKRNTRIGEELEALGIMNERADRQKYQLWEELGENPMDRRCPFSGEMISIHDLFSDKVEIEHILPFSRTLDDSMANKTIAMRHANRYKRNRTPHEAFGNSSDGYNWEEIVERSELLPKPKVWRFAPAAMEIFEKWGGFLGRQLNDTRYISRYTSQYLATIVPKNHIWVVTGRMTARLRHVWALNGILDEIAGGSGSERKKNRHDHRHHAIDAIVIAMSSRSMMQTMHHAAKRAEDDEVDKIDINELLGNRIETWDGFRDDVKAVVSEMIVSHRPRKKPQGQLHNETAYGIIGEHNPNERSQVVHRKPITDIKTRKHIATIRDPNIMNALLEATEYLPEKQIPAIVKEWCAARGIGSLRMVDNLAVIPIKDKQGKIYKAFKGDGNAYMEIYRNPNNGKVAGEIISRFDTNQKGFIPRWRREFPEQKLLMRLRINDMLAVTLQGKRQIMRIQKMDTGILFCAPHNEANVAARHYDKNDPFKYEQFSPKKLFEHDGKRVHISPSGLIREVLTDEG